MPIVRTFGCPACNYVWETTLPSDQWDAPPPSCPQCDAAEVRQEFKPAHINGSYRARAQGIAEDIATTDYHAADIQPDRRAEATPKVRYKDQTTQQSPQASTWGVAQEALQSAISAGRQSRIKYGSGLDVLQHNLKTGAEPDLIAQSKKRLIRVW